ncbi:MAG TPA: hypothetical protein VM534_05180 [Thermoanaerobaculia bacterium]|nr:hypothetical protein [Thermoanaerobaculia bacterium]
MRMIAASPLLMFVLLLAPEWIVLRSGERIEVQEIVSRSERTIVFRDTVGTLYSLPADEVRVESSDPGSGTRGKLDAETSRPGVPADKPLGEAKLAVSAEEKQRILEKLEQTAGPGSPPPAMETAAAGDEPAEREAAETREEAERAAESRAERYARAQEAIDRAQARLGGLIEEEKQLSSALLYFAGPGGNVDLYHQWFNRLADVRTLIPRAREDLSRARQALQQVD